MNVPEVGKKIFPQGWFSLDSRDLCAVMQARFLLIFVRNPELGKVKTRLARTLGDAEALRIYQYLLEKTKQTAGNCGANRLVFYAGQPMDGDLWDNAGFQRLVQSEGDLGQRMEGAFEAAFQQGADKAVIIGSDCPDLTPEILDMAFDLLDKADMVIGPVKDGGYYLLGMKRLVPAVFYGVAWSTAVVRAQTEAILSENNLTFAHLPTLSDIDTEADWKTYLEKTQWSG